MHMVQPISEANFRQIKTTELSVTKAHYMYYIEYFLNKQL